MGYALENLYEKVNLFCDRPLLGCDTLLIQARKWMQDLEMEGLEDLLPASWILWPLRIILRGDMDYGWSLCPSRIGLSIVRYTYGMFRQELHNGYQAEIPDAWLINGNPWEIKRHDVTYPIRFYGKVTITSKPSGDLEVRIDQLPQSAHSKFYGVQFIWEGGETVVALAYDTPIPGHQTFNTLNLRLWGSQPSNVSITSILEEERERRKEKGGLWAYLL